MFNRILLAADASDNALRAVEYVIKLGEELRALHAIDIHLLNVQRPVTGDVSAFVAKEALRDYHHDRGVKALERAARPARRARRGLHRSPAGRPAVGDDHRLRQGEGVRPHRDGTARPGVVHGGSSARSRRRCCSSPSSRSCS